jgi:hypothetical protein
MTLSSANDDAPSRPRGPALRWIPREHGAAFMSVHSLLLGIVAGVATGNVDLAGLLLALMLGALVLPIAAAVSAWSHPALTAMARRRAAVLSLVFLALGGVALLIGPAGRLIAVGATGACLAGVYAATRASTGARSIATELAAIACLSLLAPAAWLLVAGATDRWPLAAAAAFLEFGGTVPYVRTRVHRRRLVTTSLAERLREGSAALAWQVVALAGAAAAAMTGLVHALAALAFVPGAAKTFAGIARPERRPPIRRIGYLETAVSTIFALLVGIGLAIS